MIMRLFDPSVRDLFQICAEALRSKSDLQGCQMLFF